MQIIADNHSFPFCADSEGGMFGLYFTDKIPNTCNSDNMSACLKNNSIQFCLVTIVMINF